MIVEIREDRLARLLADDVHLRYGAGRGANGTVDTCFLQAVDWISGGDGSSDAPACVDPVLRIYGVSLNDSKHFDEWHDELKPFAPRLVNTAGDPALTQVRRWMYADWAIRAIAPMAFDAWALRSKSAELAKEWAAKLRAVPPITDAASAEVGRKVAREARSAAYADDVYAAAAAAYAAAASYPYAAAAAYAYEAAAEAADAADAANATKSRAKRAIWDECLRFLGVLCDATVPKLNTEATP
jgi:hypothetical protein